jgi:hypothetical protein
MTMNHKPWLKTWCLGLMALSLSAEAAASDDELAGRFFLTPLERATHEARRWQRQEPRGDLVTAPEPKTPAPAPEAPENLTLKGVVLRSSGKRTIWLNNQPYSEEVPLPAGITPPQWSSRNHISVVVSEGAISIPLRPGQTLNRANGKAREGYDPKPSPPISHDVSDAKAENKK